MVLLTKVAKVAGPLAGAVFIEPLLNFFAPSVKPLIRQFIESQEAKQFLKDLVEGAGVAGVGVCTNFLASQADKLIETLKPFPKLDEALIEALRKTFAHLRADLKKRNAHNILNSFDQFFIDWDDKIKQIQADDFRSRELLETKQFAHLFYEWPEVEVRDQTWWVPVEAELRAWTTYSSIPSELDGYLKENLLRFAKDALTSTLGMETYKEAWHEFHKSVGTQVISILQRLEKHIVELRELAKIAGGEFIKDNRPIEFPLRKVIDSLVRDLSSKEIYIQRNAFIVENSNVKINGLKDLITRDGYFLLAAPAGSGKSTLMARWLNDFKASLEASGSRETTNVCYHFYSKQEGTSDHSKALTILGDQLLKAHYIRAHIHSFNPATIDALLPNCLELNHPQKLLIILDGLDEAGEPSTMTDFLSLFKRVFPKTLGKNTTVILTVRDDEGANSLQHYRAELGLPLVAVRLPEVGTEALGSYLSKAADPKLQAKVGDDSFLEQVISKTEGLAIYVHYLLDELSQSDEAQWSRIIEVLPKGFEKYVSASLPAALEGKPRWEAALSFMALAQTTLGEQDLIALTELSGYKLQTIDFSRVRWNIKRWLRSEELSWAFSHQKIGEVFYELYVANERATYLEPLLAYCREWKQHRSRYVLQHYADLLRRERKETELYALASNRDFLSLQREQLTDNPSAPLRTLQVGMLYAAEQENAVMTARFSLANGAMVEEISAESWHEAYLHRGYLGALQVADNFNDGKRRVVWYLLIANQLIASNQPKEAENVLKRLDRLSFPRLPEELFFMAESVLPTLLQAATFQFLISIYRRALPPLELNRQLSEFSKIFSKTGEFSMARQFAESIEDPMIRADALGRMAAALAKAEHFSEAYEITEQAIQLIHSIEALSARASTLVSFAKLHANVGRFEEAKNLFDEAAQITRCIEDPTTRYQQLGSIAKALTAAGRFKEAKTLTDEAEQVVLPIGQASSGLSAPERTTMLADVAQIKDSERMFREAEQLARGIQNPVLRAQAVSNVAKALADAGHIEEAVEMFDKAEVIARSIEDLGLRNHVLLSLVPALARPELIGKVKQFIKSVRGPGGTYPKFLIRLAAELAANEFFSEAMDIIRDIEDLWSRSQSLNSVAMAYANAGDFEQAMNVLNESKQTARSIYAAGSQSHALINIAKALSDLGYAESAREIFKEAELATAPIEDPTIRSQALLKIGTVYSECGYLDDAKRVFDQAEEVARSVEYLVQRCEALKSVAVAFARIGEFATATRISQAHNESKFHLQISTGVVATSAKIEDFGEIDQLFSKAKRLAGFMENPTSRIQALGSVAAALAHTGRAAEAEWCFGEAAQLATSIEDSEIRSESLAKLAEALGNSQQFGRAEEIARSINDPGLRFKALRNVATALARANSFKEAERIARSIKESKSRLQALGSIATALATARHFGEAKALFDELKQNVFSIKQAWTRFHILSTVAVALTENYLLHEADNAKRIQNSWTRSQALNRIATALAYAGYFSKAEELAASIPKPNPRVHALAMIATAFVRAQHFDEAERLFKEAERIADSNKDYDSRSKAFGSIAKALVKTDSFDEALRVVHREVRGDDLFVILDEFAKSQRVDGLKNYVVLLSYNTDSALRSCAQMILLYDDQAELIFSEIRQSISRIGISKDVRSGSKL